MRARQLVSVGLLLSMVSGWATAQEIYRLTDLGAVNSTNSTSGIAINASGQVTGVFPLAEVSGCGAFLWNGTTIQDLGTLGGNHSSKPWHQCLGACDRPSTPSGNIRAHAFLWNGTTMQDLGTVGGRHSWGFAINDSGQVTGAALTAGAAESRLPVERHDDAGSRHAGGCDKFRQSHQLFGARDRRGLHNQRCGASRLPCGTARRCRTSARWGVRIVRAVPLTTPGK